MFAGVGVRRGEIQRNTVVNSLSVGVDKRSVMRMAWRECALTYLLDQRLNRRLRTGGANHADAATTGCSGDGDDGFGMLSGRGGWCGLSVLGGVRGVYHW